MSGSTFYMASNGVIDAAAANGFFPVVAGRCVAAYDCSPAGLIGAATLKNLVDPSRPATLVGNPTVAADGITCSGQAGGYIETGMLETAQLTWLVLAEALGVDAMLMSNTGTASNAQGSGDTGTGIYSSTYSGATGTQGRMWGRTGALNPTTSVPAVYSAGFNRADRTVRDLYALRVTDALTGAVAGTVAGESGTELFFQALILGSTTRAADKTRARFLSPRTVRLGAANGTGFAGPCRIRYAMAYDAWLSDAQVAEQGAEMQALAS